MVLNVFDSIQDTFVVSFFQLFFFLSNHHQWQKKKTIGFVYSICQVNCCWPLCSHNTKTPALVSPSLTNKIPFIHHNIWSHLPRTVMVCPRTWLIRRHCHRKKNTTIKHLKDLLRRICKYQIPQTQRSIQACLFSPCVSIFSQTLKNYHKTPVTFMSTSFFILWLLLSKKKKRECVVALLSGM